MPRAKTKADLIKAAEDNWSTSRHLARAEAFAKKLIGEEEGC